MCALNIKHDKCNMIYLETKVWFFDKGTSNLISIRTPVDNNTLNLRDILKYACNGCNLWQAKKGLPNFTSGNLWATQPIALLIL